MSDGHIEELENAVLELETAYELSKKEIVEDHARRYGNAFVYDPNRAQDSSGRYILLDALVQLVNARTALVMAKFRRDRYPQE